ncbi:MAG: hypothetical protein WDO74_30440 [Pseudomonadota bacterium]
MHSSEKVSTRRTPLELGDSALRLGCSSRRCVLGCTSKGPSDANNGGATSGGQAGAGGSAQAGVGGMGPAGGAGANPNAEPFINPAGQLSATRNSFGMQGYWYAYADGVTSTQSGNPYRDGMYCVKGDGSRRWRLRPLGAWALGSI